MSANNNHRVPAVAGPAPRGRGISIASALGLGLGLFVALAVGAEVLVSFLASRQNTYELVRDRTVSTLIAIVERITHHLQPALDQGNFLAARIADGTIDPADEARLADALLASLAGTPQIFSIALVRPNLRTTAVHRTGERISGDLQKSLAADPDIASAMAAIALAREPFWGEVRQGQVAGAPIVNLRTPVRRGAAFLGGLVSAISIQDLSALLAEIGQEQDQRPFVLLGRDRVLAHPGNVFGVPATPNEDQPLPLVRDYGDPVLVNLWDPANSTLLERRGDIEARFVEAPGGLRVVIYRSLAGFGPEPWIVGTQFVASDLGAQFARVRRMVLVGIGILAVAVAAAVALGAWFARPIRRLAEAVDAIRRLDIAELKPLPLSPLREIDSAARAFNAMIGTLHWIETYLPKRLVVRLMRQEGGVKSEEREVTVLFTDIVGFTAISERRPARELALLLNEHFSLIQRCIEAEGGTLDKYIGDSAMAFWNAPDIQPDHALRACRAALAIARAMKEDAERRERSGEPVFRMRIGIHTGAALIGNIGAPGRMNYTIVGDTVNTAQRLQGLGRRFDDGQAAVVALASESTARAAGDGLAMSEVGLRGLAGREKPITVFRLA